MKYLIAVLGMIALHAQAAEITTPCHVDTITSAVECGSVSVPLDYSDPKDGENIEIGFVVLPSFNPSSGRNPLFFLAGGPGQAASSIAGLVADMFSDVRSHRDIVLIDQRGTGRSGALACDIDLGDDLAPNYDLFDKALLADCAAQLPEGIAHFTTANAVRDFEQVRLLLGADKVDIYGGSYGSRAAFAYLALAGQSVDLVVLDGIAPPSIPIGLFGASAAASFSRAIDKCEAIATCAAAFPNLRADFKTVMARLNERPIETSIPHPTTGEDTQLRLWPGQFIGLLRLSLYAPDSTSLMPLLVSETAAGNYRPIAALAVNVGDVETINWLLNLTIVCNEDYPRFTAGLIGTDRVNEFGADTSYRLWREACPLMPRFDPDLDWMTAGPFDQPALLLSGAADPVTPPSNGDTAQRLFQRARHIVVPESAHIVAGSDCGAKLIAEFLASGDTESVNTACLAEMPRQRFRLDTFGSLSVSAEGRTAP